MNVLKKLTNPFLKEKPKKSKIDLTGLQVKDDPRELDRLIDRLGPEEKMFKETLLSTRRMFRNNTTHTEDSE